MVSSLERLDFGPCSAVSCAIRDQDWPSSGIIIYHVDLLAPRQQQRGYPSHPNFPAEHYRAAVIQRDGKFDIEQGFNPGMLHRSIF